MGMGHFHRNDAVETEVPPCSNILSPRHDVRPHPVLGDLVGMDDPRAHLAIGLAGVVYFHHDALPNGAPDEDHGSFRLSGGSSSGLLSRPERGQSRRESSAIWIQRERHLHRELLLWRETHRPAKWTLARYRHAILLLPDAE